MENYICINGKKTELTEEQLKQLGIEIPKVNPFERAKINTKYWVIHPTGIVDWHYEVEDNCDNKSFQVANYCTDKSIMEQRALHETLSRLLWRYSMEHDGDKINWQDTRTGKWYVCFDVEHNKWIENYVTHRFDVGVFFYNRRIAEDAIEMVVKPFMKAHPDFKF